MASGGLYRLEGGEASGAADAVFLFCLPERRGRWRGSSGAYLLFRRASRGCLGRMLRGRGRPLLCAGGSYVLFGVDIVRAAAGEVGGQ